MFYSEKEAKKFLQKQGFNVLDSVYLKKEDELSKVLDSFRFPCVIKVEGKEIVHKKRIGGVQLNIKNQKEAIESFKKMQKIKGFEGVVVQKQIDGTEILLGIKNTPEFNHVVVFGEGGTKVEEIKDVSFRIAPFGEKDALEMINETKISKKLSKEEINFIVQNIIKINALVKKFPQISELDINPLMVNKNEAQIVDARIVFK